MTNVSLDIGFSRGDTPSSFFLFRHYDIEYMVSPDASKMKFLTTREHMMQFAGPTGIAEIHHGYLGWPWVKDICPAAVEAANGQAGR